MYACLSVCLPPACLPAGARTRVKGKMRMRMKGGIWLATDPIPFPAALSGYGLCVAQPSKTSSDTRRAARRRQADVRWQARASESALPSCRREHRPAAAADPGSTARICASSRSFPGLVDRVRVGRLAESGSRGQKRGQKRVQTESRGQKRQDAQARVLHLTALAQGQLIVSYVIVE